MTTDTTSVELSRKCPITGEWDLIGKFRLYLDARRAARAFSADHGGGRLYRVVDRRLNFDGSEVGTATYFRDGELAPNRVIIEEEG